MYNFTPVQRHHTVSEKKPVEKFALVRYSTGTTDKRGVTCNRALSYGKPF